MATLNKIQQELKAPKNQFNAFGKYKYRSCEDILEAVKPLLGKSTLIIKDEMVLVGDRHYVKATAILQEDNNTVEVTAYAREALDKKGMDEAQITGAASSYARKYALNGLFLIDDTKDADSQDNSQSPKTAPKNVKEAEFSKSLDQDLKISILAEFERLEPTLDTMVIKEWAKEKTGLDLIPKNFNEILNKLKAMETKVEAIPAE